MAPMMQLVVLAVVLFACTDIDDLVVLLAFFADRRFSTKEIVLGQYLGLGVLVAVSLMASLVALMLRPEIVGLLGVLPLLIGLARGWALWRSSGDADEPPTPGRRGNVFAVAGVTIANGGDNIGTYTPVFANRSGSEVAVIIVVFAVVTAVWLALAHWLVHHPRFGAPIRRVGAVAVPVVLVALGLAILDRAGSVAFLAGSR